MPERWVKVKLPYGYVLVCPLPDGREPQATEEEVEVQPAGTGAELERLRIDLDNYKTEFQASVRRWEYLQDELAALLALREGLPPKAETMIDDTRHAVFLVMAERVLRYPPEQATNRERRFAEEIVRLLQERGGLHMRAASSMRHGSRSTRAGGD